MVPGAHVQHYKSTMGDVDGVSFAVWAPNAQADQRQGRFHPNEKFERVDLDDRSQLYRHLAERIWNPDDLLPDVGMA